MAMLLPVMIITTCLVIIADGNPPPPLKSTDINALLAFSNGLSRVGAKLDWKQENNPCDWLGIECTIEIKEDTKNGGKSKNLEENRVVRIRLPGKGLYGPIAANSIGKLDALETLSLRNNLLYGNIPPDILSIPTLKNLFLQNNSFCGDLPKFHNHLSPKLKIVDLSFNNFTGTIPPILFEIKELKTLNLQSNKFSGHIPYVEKLQKIQFLNLSDNMLDGPIPHSFQNFKSASFEHNPSLCGKPVTDDCLVYPPGYPPSVNTAYYNKLGAIGLVGSSIVQFLLL